MKNRGKITGIILIIIGLIIIFWPLSTLEGLCRLIGWCLVAGGVLYAVLGLAGSEKSYGIVAGGVISVIIGIIFIVSPGFIVTLLPKVIGLATAVCGVIFLIRTLVRSREKKGAMDIATIIVSAAAIIAGIILIFYAAAAVRLLMVVLGIFLAYIGVTRLTEKKS